MSEAKNITVGIIGSGNMGKALVLGMLREKKFTTSQIMASDVDKNQREALAKAAGISITDSNIELAKFAQIIVVAVKPQGMDAVLAELAPAMQSHHLIISIAAGIPLARLEKHLSKNPVMRVMPNTPALVGKGISAICAGSKATAAHLESASAIMRCVGEVILAPESWMDAVTATSGSGPAYVYYFIEALTTAAIDLGIDAQVAHKLVVETFAGSIALLQSSGESPETLRKRVTSPGGTTEAALRVLEEKGTRDILTQAVKAAANRGKELSRLL